MPYTILFFFFGLMMLGSANAANNYDDELNQNFYMEKFCMTFKLMEAGSMGSTLKEMEATPYPVDEYFKIPQCQSEGYSRAVKSPIFHIIADDPSARESFLKKIFLYYDIKRKSPELFTDAVNAKNTKGETFLDYIVSLQLSGRKTTPEIREVLDRIIFDVCKKGAVYSFHKNKKCPE